MNGNNNKIGRIFSININSDQDYQTYAAQRKSSVVHETSGQIHSVLNQNEVEDVDSSVDGEFRLKEHNYFSNSQHFQGSGSLLSDR